MQYVNKHRIDAHAKDIDANVLNQLSIALNWLQDKVTDYLS